MRLLGISGKKQSGKNTSFNFLMGYCMLRTAVIRNSFEVSERSDGMILPSDFFGDEQVAGKRFNPQSEKDVVKRFLHDSVYPIIRDYSFADNLKRDVCMGLLGMTYEQCYGTNEQKDAPTHLLWENMPGVITPHAWSIFEGRLNSHINTEPEELGYILKEGPMTGRDVMQYVGTDIFRNMYEPVWTKSTIKKIEQYGSKISVVTDVRFENEVVAIQEAGGKVLRLTKDVMGEDAHESENQLNPDRFDHNRFDAIIDNEKMTIAEQNDAVKDTLDQWGYLD